MHGGHEFDGGQLCEISGHDLAGGKLHERGHVVAIKIGLLVVPR
jgi:hypothetical protein